VDGWVDTIRDVIEDGESKKEDRNAVREHKLVRRLLPDYLRELEDAAAKVARLEEEKAAFERGAEVDGSDEESAEEVGNHAEELESEWKRLRTSIKNAQLRIAQLAGSVRKKGSIAAVEKRGGDSAPLREELSQLQIAIAPALVEIVRLEKELNPYWTICTSLTEARRKLRELEAALLSRLQFARDQLSEVAARELVLDLAREALVYVLTAGVTAHRQLVRTAAENLWDKYRISLTTREGARADSASRFEAILGELGYE
jgi:type I restriction enzyme M protein